MSGEKYNSRLRAAVYQRILTDNIVGIDLQENNTTRWHDKKIRNQTITEGSAVFSHAGAIVGTTATLGGTSLDEKIVSIANVFRLLYQKRRYEVEDTPLWWTWKYGKVTMRIALERMHRWVYSTRPMDVIVLMRYAMTSFYVLADEGIPNERTDVVFDLKNILAYRINREKDAKELGDEPYDEFTDLSIALKDITDNLNGEYSAGEGKRIIQIKFPDKSISSDGDLEISWKKKIVDDNEEAKRRVLKDLQKQKALLESEIDSLERNDEKLRAEERKKDLQSVTLQISSMTAGGKLLNSRDSTLSEELFLETEEDEDGKIKIISYKPRTTMEKIEEMVKFTPIIKNRLSVGKEVRATKTLNSGSKVVYSGPITFYDAVNNRFSFQTSGYGEITLIKVGRVYKKVTDSGLHGEWTIELTDVAENKRTRQQEKKDLEKIFSKDKDCKDKVSKLLNNKGPIDLKIEYLRTTDDWDEVIENNPFKDFAELRVLRKTTLAENDNAPRKPGLLQWSCEKGYRRTEKVANAFLQWLRHGSRIRNDDSVKQHYGELAFLDFFTELRKLVQSKENSKGTATKEIVMMAQTLEGNDGNRNNINTALEINNLSKQLQLIPAGAGKEKASRSSTEEKGAGKIIKQIVSNAIDMLNFDDLGVDVSRRSGTPLSDANEENNKLEEIRTSFVKQVQSKLKSQLNEHLERWKDNLQDESLSLNLNKIQLDDLKKRVMNSFKSKIKSVLGKRIRDIVPSSRKSPVNVADTNRTSSDVFENSLDSESKNSSLGDSASSDSGYEDEYDAIVSTGIDFTDPTEDESSDTTADLQLETVADRDSMLEDFEVNTKKINNNIDLSTVFNNDTDEGEESSDEGEESSDEGEESSDEGDESSDEGDKSSDTAVISRKRPSPTPLDDKQNSKKVRINQKQADEGEEESLSESSSVSEVESEVGPEVGPEAVSSQKLQNPELDGYLYDNDKEELRFIAGQLNCDFDDPTTLDAVQNMDKEAVRRSKECKDKIDTLSGQSREVKELKEEAKVIKEKMDVFDNRLDIFEKKINQSNKNIIPGDWKTQLRILRLMKEVENWENASDAEQEDEIVTEAINVYVKYKKDVGDSFTKENLEKKLKGDASEQFPWKEDFARKESILKECGEIYNMEQKPSLLKTDPNAAIIIKGWMKAWNMYIQKSGGRNNDLGINVDDLDAEFGDVDWFLFYKNEELVGAFNVSGLKSKRPELYLLLTKIEYGKPQKLRNLGTFMMLKLFEQDSMRNKFLTLEASAYAFDFYLKLIYRYNLRLFILNVAARWRYARDYKRKPKRFDVADEDPERDREHLRDLLKIYFYYKLGTYQKKVKNLVTPELTEEEKEMKFPDPDDEKAMAKYKKFFANYFIEYTNGNDRYLKDRYLDIYLEQKPEMLLKIAAKAKLLRNVFKDFDELLDVPWWKNIKLSLLAKVKDIKDVKHGDIVTFKDKRGVVTDKFEKDKNGITRRVYYWEDKYYLVDESIKAEKGTVYSVDLERKKRILELFNRNDKIHFYDKDVRELLRNCLEIEKERTIDEDNDDDDDDKQEAKSSLISDDWKTKADLDKTIENLKGDSLSFRQNDNNDEDEDFDIAFFAKTVNLFLLNETPEGNTKMAILKNRFQAYRQNKTLKRRYFYLEKVVEVILGDNQKINDENLLEIVQRKLTNPERKADSDDDNPILNINEWENVAETLDAGDIEDDDEFKFEEESESESDSEQEEEERINLGEAKTLQKIWDFIDQLTFKQQNSGLNEKEQGELKNAQEKYLKYLKKEYGEEALRQGYKDSDLVNVSADAVKDYISQFEVRKQGSGSDKKWFDKVGVRKKAKNDLEEDVEKYIRDKYENRAKDILELRTGGSEKLDTIAKEYREFFKKKQEEEEQERQEGGALQKKKKKKKKAKASVPTLADIKSVIQKFMDEDVNYDRVYKAATNLRVFETKLKQVDDKLFDFVNNLWKDRIAIVEEELRKGETGANIVIEKLKRNWDLWDNLWKEELSDLLSIPMDTVETSATAVVIINTPQPVQPSEPLKPNEEPIIGEELKNSIKVNFSNLIERLKTNEIFSDGETKKLTKAFNDLVYILGLKNEWKKRLKRWWIDYSRQYHTDKNQEKEVIYKPIMQFINGSYRVLSNLGKEELNVNDNDIKGKTINELLQRGTDMLEKAIAVKLGKEEELREKFYFASSILKIAIAIGKLEKQNFEESFSEGLDRKIKNAEKEVIETFPKEIQQAFDENEVNAFNQEKALKKQWKEGLQKKLQDCQNTGAEEDELKRRKGGQTQDLWLRVYLKTITDYINGLYEGHKIIDNVQNEFAKNDFMSKKTDQRLHTIAVKDEVANFIWNHFAFRVKQKATTVKLNYKQNLENYNSIEIVLGGTLPEEGELKPSSFSPLFYYKIAAENIVDMDEYFQISVDAGLKNEGRMVEFADDNINSTDNLGLQPGTDGKNRREEKYDSDGIDNRSAEEIEEEEIAKRKAILDKCEEKWQNKQKLSKEDQQAFISVLKDDYDAVAFLSEEQKTKLSPYAVNALLKFFVEVTRGVTKEKGKRFGLPCYNNINEAKKYRYILEVSEEVEEPKKKKTNDDDGDDELSSEAFIKEFNIFKVVDCTDEKLQAGPGKGMLWLLYEECEKEEGTLSKASSSKLEKQLRAKTVNQLKDILKGLNKAVSGKKAELVKRIMDAQKEDEEKKSEK